MARPQDFDLAKELAKPSFTPARSDAAALAGLIASDVEAPPAAAAALAGLGDAGRTAIAARLPAGDDGGRARLIAVLGLLARGGDRDAREMVLAHLTDAASRVRRAAAVALGKLGGDDARAALLARWDAGDVTPDERRALAEALGKVGGDAALARLHDLDPGDDDELARRRDRAVLMADRSARRDEASEVRTDVAPPQPIRVRLGCRAGLGDLLAAELATVGLRPHQHGDATAEITLSTAWSTLHASRLWTTAAIRIDLDPRSELAEAIVHAITSAEVRALLRAWTRGPIRWRLGMMHGHKRSIVWRVARDVTAIAPELINDPTATTWDAICNDETRTLELLPRRAHDPRFAWRVADVPAASHPTIAAALAWVAEARPGDRVWDPFCGSGSELIERARRGPYRTLAGSDLDEAALAAARANLEAAGIGAELALADARVHIPGAVDLIITNPPLGSRVQLDARALLLEALPNLVRRLAPAGRLVWITPATRKTSPIAEQLGLRRVRSFSVDLGGVRGHLERWDR